MTGNTDNLDAYRNYFNTTNPYARHLGITVTVLQPDYAEAVMEIVPQLININGSLHGGAILSLADIVVGVLSKANNVPTVTLEGKLNFIRGAASGKVRGEARILHSGRTTGVYDVKIYNDSGVCNKNRAKKE